MSNQTNDTDKLITCCFADKTHKMDGQNARDEETTITKVHAAFNRMGIDKHQKTVVNGN